MSKQMNDWRYRCPAGHSSWTRTSKGYYCESCARNGGEHKTFDELRDMKREPLEY